MDMEIREKYEVGQKQYFDLVVNDVRIRHCFVEPDENGVLRLRLPTQNNHSGIHQTVYFEKQEHFNEICNQVQEYFEEE